MTMVDEPNRPGRLGRGLAALLGDAADDAQLVTGRRGLQRLVPTGMMRPNRFNPRKTFTEDALEELTASIRERGIIQPILVRPLHGSQNEYEIIAGERRWRAAQRVGLHEVPVVLIEAADRDALEIAIIENVQREDLNPLEEAAGYEQLMAQFGYVQADLAKVVGKSRSHVANTLRLSRLPESVKAQVAEGLLSAGHARALVAMDDPERMARRIIEEGLTVRDIERLGQDEPAKTGKGRKPKAEKDADTRALEQALMDVTGLDVRIDHRASGGAVTIRYTTLEQLEALCRRLKA
jgi:ParB family transcriptional regulator, chromosome partitioning protein